MKFAFFAAQMYPRKVKRSTAVPHSGFKLEAQSVQPGSGSYYQRLETFTQTVRYSAVLYLCFYKAESAKCEAVKELP